MVRHRAWDGRAYDPASTYDENMEAMNENGSLSAEDAGRLDDFYEAMEEESSRFVGYPSNSLFDYYVERLEAHGYRGDREMIQSTMSIDIELNAQGLEVWLERKR